MPDSFTVGELVAIPYVVSQARFSTYLRVEQNDARAALALYRWNLQLSSAFFMPLQICEVAIRNAIAEAIEAAYGPKWPWLKGFSYTLPTPKKGFKPRDELLKVSRLHPNSVGQIMAELRFVFWQYMFTAGQEPRLWTPHLRAVLPNLPAGQISTWRQKIHDEIEAIRGIRNRIAHHEPIFARNIVEEYQRILALIEWRSPETADWVDRTQTVTQVLAQRPRTADGGIYFQYPVR